MRDQPYHLTGNNLHRYNHCMIIGGNHCTIDGKDSVIINSNHVKVTGNGCVVINCKDMTVTDDCSIYINNIKVKDGAAMSFILRDWLKEVIE